MTDAERAIWAALYSGELLRNGVDDTTTEIAALWASMAIHKLRQYAMESSEPMLKEICNVR